MSSARTTERGTEAIRARRTEELRATARHHRQRRDLYRAKVYGPKPTSTTRLQELERAATVAERQLRRSEGDARTEAIRLQAQSEL